MSESLFHETSLLRRLGRQLRRVGKLGAFVAGAAAYTLYAGAAVRLRSRADRALAKARHQQRGARLLLRVLGVRVRVTGHRAALASSTPTLLVCNHLGLLDPFVLASRLRTALVGKAEIEGWPAAGWVARTMGVIFVQRGSTGGVEAFVERVQQRLASGVDVLAFPEGTTNARLQVLPFKTGVFRGVAGQQGERVLPLYLHVRAINGVPTTESRDAPASHAAPQARRERVIWAGGTEPALSHAWRLLGLRSVVMDVRVGAPIATGGRGRKELARRAQAAVETMAADTFGLSHATKDR